jgi:photosystem II stability/assembly factor-like uncharacterized protein
MCRLAALALIALIIPACNSGSDKGGSGGGTPAPPPGGNHAPGVALVRPSTGATFTAGSPIDLEADVSDAEGWVARVDFYDGSILLGTVLAFPFRLSSTPVSSGSHSLTAVATDNDGASNTSIPISINVTPPGGGVPPNQPPTVTMTSPEDGSSALQNYPVLVEAAASDPDGGVVGVQFFDGTASIGSVTAAPYRLSWTASTLGSHSLRAVATDTSGAMTTSSSVTITVASAPVTVVPQGSLKGVFFADSSHGWIVGEQGRIYATSDGGLTWVRQESSTTAELQRVQFINTNVGWIVGHENVALRTTDGGTTWSRMATGTTSAHFVGLSFVNATTGWIVGSENVLKTVDGGATWTAQNAGVSTPSGAISFVNSGKGWIDGGGRIVSTADGGATWSSQSTEFTSITGFDHFAYFHDARFISDSTGIMAGWERGSDILFRTTDGGATWTRFQLHESFAQWHGIAFGDARHWWAVGTRGNLATDQASISASTDGGVTWVDQDSPSPQPLNGVWFVSASTGWAVGEDGVVLRTTDGGATWVLLSGRT